MKETPISTCEKTFLLDALREGKRIDGRGFSDRRKLDIVFGSDWGCCYVSLGQTRVLAQVSCHITEPRATRPNEGMLMVNVELSPMAAPKFETGRLSEDGVEVNRVLERCLKESRCLDMESLCIVAEEKVWCVRLDMHVLNHEGNIIDCASVAGLAALCHFRRPDVSLSGSQVVVHPPSERDPVKLAVHHHPVCTTFAFFVLQATSEQTSENKLHVCDPGRHEESVMNGKLVFGINPYREICTLHLAGRMHIDTATVLKLTHHAAEQAKEIVNKIKFGLEEDEEVRAKGDDVGLALGLQKKMSILSHDEEATEVDFPNMAAKSENSPVEEPIQMEVSSDAGVVEMKSQDEEDIELVKTVSAEEKRKERTLAEIEIADDDSEEEESVTVSGKEVGQGRGWYEQKKW